MKVAIFIHGQPRLIDKSLFNHLDKQNIDYDIYISYWNNLTNYSQNTTGVINNSNLMNNPNIHNILVKHYNPKRIVGENEPILNFTDRYDDCPDKNVNRRVPELCAIGLQKAFSLCDNIQDYDWLIKTRFDLVFPLKKIVNQRCRMQIIHNRTQRINYLKNDLAINFTNCDPNKINVPDIYNFNKSDKNEPISEFWIVKPKYKNLFTYYNDLKFGGNNPANESIIKHICDHYNYEFNSMNITIGINRMYNTPDYVFN
jgi:hypothetical protein